MITLIIESGSSHSSWIVLDDQVIDSQELPGINPTAMPDSIEVIDEYKCSYEPAISKIYFYGSGVSNPQKGQEIRDQLSLKFPNSEIMVASDILAACHCFNIKEPKIVSILGTGVNTVLFDGTEIISSIRSLGYLIDEEGSGFNIGRLIIKRFIRSQMQSTDIDLFQKTYELMPGELVKNVYQHPYPNFLIASYSKFLNICSPCLRNEILSENFNAYALNHIQKIDNYRDYSINFVGSIAYVFSTELKEAMHNIGATVSNIVQSPIEGLINYHINI